MRRQRGSAILFVVVLIGAITTILLATATITNNARVVQTRREDAVAASLALDGLIAQASADNLAGTLVLPTTRSLTLNAATCAVTITDNSVSKAYTMKLIGTTTVHGRTFSINKVVSSPFTASPFFYALFTNSSVTIPITLTTGSGGSNGDIASNGNITLTSSGTQINGDIDVVGVCNPNSADVQGAIWTGAPTIPYPALSTATYSAAKTSGAGSTLNSYAFSSGASYELLYRGSGMNLQGTFSGNGTVCVNGDLSITGDVSYANSSSHVVFLVKGNISVGLLVHNISGYYFCTGSFSALSLFGKSLVRGGLVCNSFSTTGGLTINYDTYIWDTPSEAAKLKIPGFWP